MPTASQIIITTVQVLVYLDGQNEVVCRTSCCYKRNSGFQSQGLSMLARFWRIAGSSSQRVQHKNKTKTMKLEGSIDFYQNSNFVLILILKRNTGHISGKVP